MSAPALTATERGLLEQVAEAIARRQLAVPAMMALETVSPMNVLGSSVLHMLSPMLSIGFPRERLEALARLLERREAIPQLIQLIDEADERRRQRERAAAPPRRRGLLARLLHRAPPDRESPP